MTARDRNNRSGCPLRGSPGIPGEKDTIAGEPREHER